MAKCIIVTVRLSVENDRQLLNKICSASSVSSYIKSLVAKDIEIDYPVNLTFSDVPKTIPSGGNLCISLNPKTESKILEKLNTVPKRSDYIRSLVYDDINAAVKSKSFSQLSDEIDLDEYTDMAQFTAARLAELADILRSNGFLSKASECTRLVDMLNNWAMNAK